MTTYDPDLLRLVAVQQASTLPLRLGVSILGTSTDTSRTVATASINITSGYAVGEFGELSLDPISASGTLAQKGLGTPVPVTPTTPDLAPGNYVQVMYGATVLFTGVVDTISSSLEANPEAKGGWIKRFTYTLLSQDAVLLGQTVTWDAPLPAEGALYRLARWFSVEFAHLSPERKALLYEPMGSQPAGGSMTLLEVARAFTARTLLPLVGTVAGTTHVKVVDWCQTWDGTPPVATSALTAQAVDWAHAAEFQTKPRVSTMLLSGPVAPTPITVLLANETRNGYAFAYSDGTPVTAAGKILMRAPVRWVESYVRSSSHHLAAEDYDAPDTTMQPWRIALHARVGGTSEANRYAIIDHTKFSMNHNAIALIYPALTYYQVKLSWRRFEFADHVVPVPGVDYRMIPETAWDALPVTVMVGTAEINEEVGEYTTPVTAIAGPERRLDVYLPAIPYTNNGWYGVIFDKIEFIPVDPPTPNELRIDGTVPLPSDGAASRTIDAPTGTQHLENFAKLSTLNRPRFLATTAQVITDDAVLLDSQFRCPDVVGTAIGGAQGIARVTHNFTTKQYTATVEYAPPMPLYSSPFVITPHVITNADGFVRIGYGVTAEDAALWHGDLLFLVTTGEYCRQHPADVAQLGHLVPGTAPYHWFLSRPTGAGLRTQTFGNFPITKTGGQYDLEVGQAYYLTAYLTSITNNTLPIAPGLTRTRLSYPSATLKWIQA